MNQTDYTRELRSLLQTLSKKLFLFRERTTQDPGIFSWEDTKGEVLWGKLVLPLPQTAETINI